MDAYCSLSSFATLQILFFVFTCVHLFGILCIFFFALSIAFLCYSRQIWVSAQIFFPYVENVYVQMFCVIWQCGAPPNRRSSSLVQSFQSTFIMNHFVCWNISFAFLRICNEIIFPLNTFSTFVAKLILLLHENAQCTPNCCISWFLFGATESLKSVL